MIPLNSGFRPRISPIARPSDRTPSCSVSAHPHAFPSSSASRQVCAGRISPTPSRTGIAGAGQSQASKLTNDSESLRIARGAILYLAQMIHIHEKVTQVPDSPGSLTMPMPFERTDTDLTELG